MELAPLLVLIGIRVKKPYVNLAGTGDRVGHTPGVDYLPLRSLSPWLPDWRVLLRVLAFCGNQHPPLCLYGTF